MESNNDFDSQKIIEEIENLENDTSFIKKRKAGINNFMELVIVIALIIFIITTAGSEIIKDFLRDKFGSNYTVEEDYYADENDTPSISSNVIEIEEFIDSNYENTIIFDNKENIVYDEEAILKQKFEKEKNNLNIVEEGKNINGELLISVENKNANFVHDLDVYTVFYKSDKIISVDSQTIEIILENNKKFLKIDRTPSDYDRFEVFIDKSGYYEFPNELLHKNLNYEAFIENEILEIEIKNNSKKIDRANFTIVYFDKDKNILDIEYASDFDIGKILGGSVRGYGVWDETNREYIEYDSYEIILDYAGNYNY